MTEGRNGSDSLAAELALGLLNGEDLRAAKGREDSDPAFAAEVARWRGRFAPLADELDSVAPPEALWSRVERSIGIAGYGNVVALGRKVNLWRGLAGGMTALAASLAIVVVNGHVAHHVSAPAARPMVAIIKAGGDVAAVANWDASSNRLLVSEVKMPVVPSHDYQLWLIPANGKPRSVGVMPNAPLMRLSFREPMSTALAGGGTLAVSLEPLGGSPRDAPTGPVVASGTLIAV